MKKNMLALAVLLLNGTLSAGPIDSEIDSLLSEYFKIQVALAADTTKGIDTAAERVYQMADEAVTKDPAVRELLTSVKEAAKQIQGQDLAAARQQFFELSKPLLVYLQQFHSSKELYSRFFCSMAKKGWIQADRGTRNPYYGSSMLACGDLIQ